MRHRGQILRTAAAAALFCAFFSVCALAADYIHGCFLYTVSEDSVTITAYTGREETVTVPAFIAGHPVNTIAGGVFADSDMVQSVILPDTVVMVEPGAFRDNQSVSYAPVTTAAPATVPTPTPAPAEPATVPTPTPTPTPAASGGGNSAPTASPKPTSAPAAIARVTVTQTEEDPETGWSAESAEVEFPEPDLPEPESTAAPAATQPGSGEAEPTAGLALPVILALCAATALGAALLLFRKGRRK